MLFTVLSGRNLEIFFYSSICPLGGALVVSQPFKGVMMDDLCLPTNTHLNGTSSCCRYETSVTTLLNSAKQFVSAGLTPLQTLQS